MKPGIKTSEGWVVFTVIAALVLAVFGVHIPGTPTITPEQSATFVSGIAALYATLRTVLKGIEQLVNAQTSAQSNVLDTSPASPQSAVLADASKAFDGANTSASSI